MDKATLLAEQYADESSLGTRAEFNGRFTVDDRHPHEFVRERMARHEGGRILDLGCGPGGFWTVNAGDLPADWRPVLADFWRGMVEEARHPLGREAVARGEFETAVTDVDPAVTDAGTAVADAETAVVDAEALPFAGGAVDAVLALQMLYHVPDRAAAVRECRRVLAPDGRLYASAGHPENGRELYELMDAVADGPVEPVSGSFTGANGREQLSTAFDRVERHTFENEVRCDDADALVAYALSLPLSDAALVAFDPEDADALRERAAERIDSEGAVTWRKDYVLFVAGAAEAPGEAGTLE